MSDRIRLGRNKASTSTFSNPSLVSPNTPTLANPIRSFGLPTNNALTQTGTEVSTDQQEAQFASDPSLELLPVKEKPIGHDISRISLRRPQAKLQVGEPGDKYEQEADWMTNQVMRMPERGIPNGFYKVPDYCAVGNTFILLKDLVLLEPGILYHPNHSFECNQPEYLSLNLGC